MTRVEKYHRYREEISNMKVENFSTKKEVSSQIEKDDYHTKVISYDKVMDIFDIYDTDATNKKHKRLFHLRKDQIIYCLIATIIILIILIPMIFIGIDLWGK